MAGPWRAGVPRFGSRCPKLHHYQKSNEHCPVAASFFGDRWEATANLKEAPKKAIRTLALLVNWEIWNERNRRIFQYKDLSSGSLLAKIKEEAKTSLLERCTSLPVRNPL
uniref:Uncharacterized protein n=1 Tax=Oryza rufipogon TaxID=4529 RepID=A0A0E0PZK5_ORYRU